MTLGLGVANANGVGKGVASINGESYESLDDAIAAAESGDVIELHQNTESEGFIAKKNITISGNSKSISFSNKGIYQTADEITFEDCKLNFQGVGSTPSNDGGSWMTIFAKAKATTNFINCEVSLDGNGTASNVHAIYLGGYNTLNFKRSSLSISSYKQDAIEHDSETGECYINFDESTYISNSNRQAFTNTFYVDAKDSKVNVSDCKASGSNGSYFTLKNTKMNFSNIGYWGISAAEIQMTDGSELSVKNSGYSGVYTQVLNIDASCSLNVESCGTRDAAYTNNTGVVLAGTSSSASVIQDGANVTISN